MKHLYETERHLSLNHALTSGSKSGMFESSWSTKPGSDNASPLMSSESFGYGVQDQAYDVHANKPDCKEIVLDERHSGSGTVERVSDANIWLPHAAEVYNLSRNIEDYVLVPVPGMFSSIPNTNGDSVTLNELLRFNPYHGQQSYKIWKGQPTFVEHDNKDYTQAKGVILDAFLRPLKRFGGGKYYKLVLLHAFDRSKDPMLVNRILTRQVNSYSVGFYFKSYKCSICGLHVTENSHSMCNHTAPKKKTYVHSSGNLAYRSCFDIKPFESSSVGVPAFITAISDHVMDPLKV